MPRQWPMVVPGLKSEQDSGSGVVGTAGDRWLPHPLSSLAAAEI